MPGIRLKTFALLVALCLTGIHSVTAQDTPTISGPVTALRVDGDRLLIGQGPVLAEARTSADGVQVIRTRNLGHHEIRAITTSAGITCVLTEDGLTTLDSQDNVLGFAQGGGQRLIVRNGHVYIAALGAGLRILKLEPSGKLIRLGALATLGPAYDVVAETDTWLWVAEGEAGVRLYDFANPSSPRLLTWIGNLSPATLVRTSGPRLFVGYANHVTLLDTINVQGPRMLGTISLDGSDTQVADLVIQGSRALVGRLGAGGPDVVALDFSNPKTLTTVGQFGVTGAGERLALYGNDLFAASGRQGLRRLRLAAETPGWVATWELISPLAACSAELPADPVPSNLADVLAGQVTLRWRVGCNPAAIQLQIDGTPVAPVDGTSYSFTPRRGVTTWQVTTLDEAGKRIDGPRWTFESVVEGWLATPISVPQNGLVYTPPAILVDTKSPGVIIATTCAALILGMVLVIAAAWGVGTLAERRAGSRQE